MIKATVLVAIFSSILVIGVFIDKFGIGYWEEIEKWAQTGDFFGGILNPIFSFLGLILISYTLMQNKLALKLSQQALETSNRELELSRKEYAKSVVALNAQVSQSQIQTFENTFFSLLNQHNELLDQLKLKKVHLFPSAIIGTPDQKNEYTKELFGEYCDLNQLSFLEQVVIVLCSQGNIGGAKSNLFQFNTILKPYLILLYQILKYINEQDKLDEKFNPKRYSNILRALLPNSLLVIIFINASYEYESYKMLLIKYCFFEHMELRLGIRDPIALIDGVRIYGRNSFGENKSIPAFEGNFNIDLNVATYDEIRKVAYVPLFIR
ncbi:putative phage abortive infection protein [Aeromonas hydrophila]|uniref:putative phage abortive infection protein n=1 Tax=Aeromonas hydrophila TaxID=644 RepID=UPI0005A92A0A|nr:putative phage abortive infection protein [Aeromonas hydrophila]